MVLKTESRAATEVKPPSTSKPDICILWIDWYAYHVARFRALCEFPALRGRVAGVELVGGTGVHRGLQFREALPSDLPVTTLFEQGNWGDLNKWKIAREIWRYLDQHQPRTLFIPGYYNLPAIAAAIWGRLHRKQTVLMTESTEADHRRKPILENVKAVLIRALFSWSIAGGRPHIRYLEKLGFPKNRIGRSYDVVDNRFFREQASRDRQRNTAQDFRLPENYFLFVGRLAAEKNVSGLLESYKAYRNSGGTWSLVLVGDGPLRESLLRESERSGHKSDIYFEGLKNSLELSPYYAFAGCFVLPSSREPWGLVVNEAMASGLPVIITRQCGCAEDLVEEGANGFVFEAADHNAITHCLHRIEKLSPVARKNMGEHSLEIIDRYSPEQWASEVARIANGQKR